jgi:hypothetical protein
MRTAPSRLISSLFVIGVSITFCGGCASSTAIERSDEPLQDLFKQTVFHFELDDKSKGKPDNIDGHLNLLWTDDSKREDVVTTHWMGLVSKLQASGFVITRERGESTVHARLKLKSVRYDPVSGWITDDARLEYCRASDGELLGAVVAKEKMITPTVSSVFESLFDGSLQLWSVR